MYTNGSTALTYRLSAYEGPLDLLYRLIQLNKIDICDIPIAELADQYISFLEKAEEKDMDSISEFALLASTLLEIKSKMLLPKASPEEDPRQELVDMLQEYRKMKLAAEVFMSLDEGGEDIFCKKPDFELMDNIKPRERPEELLGDMTALRLYEIFKEVIGRKELKIDKIRSSFKSVTRDLYTVEDKRDYLLRLLFESPLLSFRGLMENCGTKMEMVVTFLALLELIKMKKVSVCQYKTFADIEIRKCV